MTPTLERLIVNAIWRELRANRWRGPTSTRRLSDHGDRPNYRAIANGQTPRAPSLNDTIRQRAPEALATTITPDHRNQLPAPLHVCLWRHQYTHALEHASQATREDLALAIVERAPDPYAWDTNGRGEHHLQRTYEPFHTNLLLALLHQLAQTAGTWREDEDPLITNRDVPCPSTDNEPPPARSCVTATDVVASKVQ